MNTVGMLDRFSAKASDNTIIRAIRRGLLYMLPLVLVGSFVLMLLNLPIDAFQNFLHRLFGEHWRDVALSMYKGTFEVMSLTAVMSVSYALCREHPLIESGAINPLSVILAAFCSFIAFGKPTGLVVDADSAGAKGMFVAIVVAITATALFLFFHKHCTLRVKVYAYDADALLLSSLRTFLPMLLTIASFALLRAGLNLTGISAALESAAGRVSALLLTGENGILSTILYNLITHILWFFGMHGTNMLEGVSRELFVNASEVNIALHAAGAAPTQVITKEFYDAFVYMGGAGCTLGLIIALLIAGRSSKVDRVAHYSLLPGLFNINEIMVYGLPIIFNPHLLVPFLLSPVVLSIITYGAMTLGLVPLTIARVEWTTPILISGYVSTGSVAGIVLQLVNLTVSVLLYIPFIRMYERQLARNNRLIFESLSKELQSPHHVGNQAALMINRNDEMGAVTRSLATEIRGCLGEDIREGGLYLEYQPKLDASERVRGCEALIRWQHPIYGRVSPLVILAVADEAGLADKLGIWVMRQAFDQLGQWHRAGYETLGVSVNLSPKQVREDEDLVYNVLHAMRDSGVDPRFLELELTENETIDQSESTRKRLGQITQLGLALSIDDFGMGNSSILYLRDFGASVVKIDISLVRNITTNKHSQEIVRSILSLCRELGVGVVAEGVEERDQLDKLKELGCNVFQGFYYSRPLPPDDFVAYVDKMGAARDETP